MEINIIPKFLDNALTPIAKEAGEALSDIINLARSPLLRAKATRDLKMKYFLNDLEIELNKIPEKNITEPPLAIIGPAVENLFKYYLDEEHIVQAYKKLISCSMNSRYKNQIHPIIPSIITQMSPKDAEFLCKISNNSGHVISTSFELCYEKSTMMLPSVLLFDDIFKDIKDENPDTITSDMLLNNNYYESLIALEKINVINSEVFSGSMNEEIEKACKAKVDSLDLAKFRVFEKSKINFGYKNPKLYKIDYFGRLLCKILDYPTTVEISYGNSKILF